MAIVAMATSMRIARRAEAAAAMVVVDEVAVNMEEMIALVKKDSTIMEAIVSRIEEEVAEVVGRMSVRGK